MQESQEPSPSPFPNPSGTMTPETEKLFKKWLKLQITQFYWNMFSRLFIFILIVGSIIVSTFTLAPIVKSQLEILTGLQSSLSSLPKIPSNQATDSQGSPLNVFDIINQLSPQQQDQIKDIMEQ